MKYSELSDEMKARYDQWKAAKTAKQAGTATGDHDFSAMNMIKNVPGSGMQMISDMGEMISDPIGTAKGVGNLALGAAQKLIPGEQEEEKYADAVGQFFANRYGSIDKFQKSLEEDPVGVAADLSLALTGAGGAARGAGAVTKASKLADAGKAIQKAGTAVDPFNAVVNPALKAGTAVASKFIRPSDLYKSAAKFSTIMDRDMGHGTREEIADTLLKQGVMPTAKGADKIDALLRSFDDEVNRIIDASTAAGQTVPIDVITSKIADLRVKMGGLKWDGKKNIEKMDKYITENLDDFADQGITDVTARQLQDFKQDLYSQLNFKLKQGKLGDVKNRTGKAIARGAREGIEQMVPEVGPINKQWGNLLEARSPFYQSFGRIENRDMGGIGPGVKAAGGGAAFGEPGAILGGIHGVLDSPVIKANIAKKMYDWERRGLIDSATHGSELWKLIRQGAFQSGRDED